MTNYEYSTLQLRYAAFAWSVYRDLDHFADEEARWLEALRIVTDALGAGGDWLDAMGIDELEDVPNVPK
jgi:hypothetical protein